jgi:hypothetical protein
MMREATPPATSLTIEEHNDALAWQALRDRAREQGRPLRVRQVLVVATPAAPTPCPTCKTTESLPSGDLPWAGSASPGAARAGENTPEKPSKSRPESSNPTKFAYQGRSRPSDPPGGSARGP